MSAEDYDDVPGLCSGSDRQPLLNPRFYKCNRCRHPITFKNKKPFNQDGTAHRCIAKSQSETDPPPQAAMFAMAAMNAIINGQIQAGGVDFIHRMNFYDVADSAWQVAAAMVKREKDYRDEIIAASKGGAAP